MDLTDLAARAQFAVTVNDAGTTSTFTYRGRQFVAPLDAASIKVGNEWKPLPDIVMLKGDRFLIPAEAFAE